MKTTRKHRLIALLTALLLIFLSGCSQQVKGLDYKVYDLTFKAAEIHDVEKGKDDFQSLTFRKKGEDVPYTYQYQIYGTKIENIQEKLGDKLAEGQTVNDYYLNNAEYIDRVVQGFSEGSTEPENFKKGTVKIGDKMDALDLTWDANLYDEPYQFRCIRFYEDDREYVVNAYWKASCPAEEVKLLDDIIASMKLAAK